MIITTTSPEDAQAVLDLQRLAYRSEAEVDPRRQVPSTTGQPNGC